MRWLNLGQSDAPCCDIFGVGAAVQGGAQIAGAALQANAANNATNKQYQASQNALDFQKQEWGQTQANQAPFLQAGASAVNSLGAGLGLSGYSADNVQTGEFNQSYPGGQYQNAAFTGSYNAPAPMANFDPNTATAQQLSADDPGYRFRLNEGMNALQNSWAATGLSGGAAAAAAQQYGQGMASQEYQNAYQRAATSYGLNQQTYGQNMANSMNQYNTGLTAYQANTGNNLQQYQTNYNTYQQDQTRRYNQLASLAGYGQTATNQLASSGNMAAQNVGNLMTQQGNALAAGSAAQGNIWGGLASGLGNTFGQYQMAESLRGSGSGGGYSQMSPYAPDYPVGADGL